MLTGEGVSLAVKQAAAAVKAIADDMASSYESAWHPITRDYRLLTRGLVLTTVPKASSTCHRARMHPATCGIRAGCAHPGSADTGVSAAPSPSAAGLQLSTCCKLIPEIRTNQHSGPAATHHMDTMTNRPAVTCATGERQHHTIRVRRGCSDRIPAAPGSANGKHCRV